MTLESLHIVESTSKQELDPTEMLILRRVDVHHDIGRLSLELARLNQQLNAKVAESIQLSQELAEAGVDKHELARHLQTPIIHEESPTYHSELFEPTSLEVA